MAALSPSSSVPGGYVNSGAGAAPEGELVFPDFRPLASYPRAGEGVYRSGARNLSFSPFTKPLCKTLISLA